MNQPLSTTPYPQEAMISATPTDGDGAAVISQLEALKKAALQPHASADQIANWVHATLHAHGDGH